MLNGLRLTKYKKVPFIIMPRTCFDSEDAPRDMNDSI